RWGGGVGGRIDGGPPDRVGREGGRSESARWGCPECWRRWPAAAGVRAVHGSEPLLPCVSPALNFGPDRPCAPRPPKYSGGAQERGRRCGRHEVSVAAFLSRLLDEVRPPHASRCGAFRPNFRQSQRAVLSPPSYPAG